MDVTTVVYVKNRTFNVDIDIAYDFTPTHKHTTTVQIIESEFSYVNLQELFC